MQFPKEIYVTIENDGEDTYLNAHESRDTTTEIGQTVRVATYHITAVENVSARVVVETAPASNRSRSSRKSRK